LRLSRSAGTKTGSFWRNPRKILGIALKIYERQTDSKALSKISNLEFGMFKRWFESSSNGNGSSHIGEHRNGSVEIGLTLPAQQESECPPRSAHLADAAPISREPALKPPQVPCGILKVVEMANSEHLAGLSPEAKRCAIMMALDAVGAGVEDLLQDAVVRQRALNDQDKEQQDALRRFEEAKAEESRKLQGELDSLTSEYMARVQANADEVAREQDRFRAWQRKRQQESQQIADAAAFCVPDGMGQHGGSLASVLERAAGARR
jgi:hypothetical protein